MYTVLSSTCSDDPLTEGPLKMSYCPLVPSHKQKACTPDRSGYWKDLSQRICKTESHLPVNAWLTSMYNWLLSAVSQDANFLTLISKCSRIDKDTILCTVCYCPLLPFIIWVYLLEMSSPRIPAILSLEDLPWGLLSSCISGAQLIEDFHHGGVVWQNPSTERQNS